MNDILVPLRAAMFYLACALRGSQTRAEELLEEVRSLLAAARLEAEAVRQFELAGRIDELECQADRMLEGNAEFHLSNCYSD